MRSAVVALHLELHNNFNLGASSIENLAKLNKYFMRERLEVDDFHISPGCNTTYMAVSSQREVTQELFVRKFASAYTAAKLPCVPGRADEQFRILEGYQQPETAEDNITSVMRWHRFGRRK